MINVEFNIKQFNQIVISLDSFGLEVFITQLGYILGKYDHFHLLCQSWSTLGDEALSENILSGKDFHWCHELSIGTSAEDRSKDNINVFVDAEITNSTYSVLQISIIRTLLEIPALLASLKELTRTKTEFTLDTMALITIKRKLRLTKKQHCKLNLTFKYL